jgi:hypothetical protein
MIRQVFVSCFRVWTNSKCLSVSELAPTIKQLLTGIKCLLLIVYVAGILQLCQGAVRLTVFATRPTPIEEQTLYSNGFAELSV